MPTTTYRDEKGRAETVRAAEAPDATTSPNSSSGAGAQSANANAAPETPRSTPEAAPTAAKNTGTASPSKSAAASPTAPEPPPSPKDSLWLESQRQPRPRLSWKPPRAATDPAAATPKHSGPTSPEVPATERYTVRASARAKTRETLEEENVILWDQNEQLRERHKDQSNMLVRAALDLHALQDAAGAADTRPIRAAVIRELARLLPVAIKKARAKNGSPALLRLITRAIKTL